MLHCSGAAMQIADKDPSFQPIESPETSQHLMEARARYLQQRLAVRDTSQFLHFTVGFCGARPYVSQGIFKVVSTS